MNTVDKNYYKLPWSKYYLAWFEIMEAKEKIIGKTFEEALLILHGFNNFAQDDPEPFFDFETSHAIATMIFKNGQFHRVGYGIEVYESDSPSFDIIESLEKLQFMALTSNLAQALFFLENTKKELEMGLIGEEDRTKKILILDAAIEVLKEMKK